MIPGIAQTDGKQDHASFFELCGRLHCVALGHPIRQQDGDAGHRGRGVAAARETLPQNVFQS